MKKSKQELSSVAHFVRKLAGISMVVVLGACGTAANAGTSDMNARQLPATRNMPVTSNITEVETPSTTPGTASTSASSSTSTTMANTTTTTVVPQPATPTTQPPPTTAAPTTPAPSVSEASGGLRSGVGGGAVAQRQSVTVILGDSITHMNETLVTSALSSCAAPPVAVHALSARSVNRSYDFYGWRNSGVDEVGKIAATGFDPTRWVVELGTNDAQVVTTPAQADALVASLLVHFDASDEVIWVTVVNDLFPAGAALINAAVVRSGVGIADWAAIVQPGDLYDGVHPSPAGATKLADLYCQVLSGR